MNLRDYRTTVLRMSQDDFTEWLNARLARHRYRLKTTKSAVHAYETGRRAPPLHLAIAVAEVTNDKVRVNEWTYLVRRFPFHDGPGLLDRVRKREGQDGDP